MGQPLLNHDTPIHDNLVKAILVTVALSIVIGVVFFCLPDKGRLARYFGREKPAVSRQTERISYSNPMVRSTLDIPWAHAHKKYPHRAFAQN